MLDFLRLHGAISKYQHDFLSGKSTTSNLLESLNEWTLAIDNKCGVNIAYIDYAKAFDSVSHSKLCHKVASYGICGNLLEWIRNFLNNRQQCTRVGNAFSSVKQLTSGVVQGSCLGPLLFLLFINDVTNLFDNIL